MDIPNDLSVSLIAAVSNDGAIGRKGSLPWGHIPADMKRFRLLTMGKSVIMGRRTHESIGRALPGRRNIVLSRLWSYNPIDCLTSPSLEHAFTLCDPNTEVMVIGGSEVFYKVFHSGIPFGLYLTVVDVDVPDGDAFFPWIDRRYMRVYKRETIEPGPLSPYGLQFIDAIFDRSKKADFK